VSDYFNSVIDQNIPNAGARLSAAVLVPYLANKLQINK
jgi:hypothetical protein